VATGNLAIATYSGNRDLTSTYSGDRKFGNSYIQWRQEIWHLHTVATGNLATATYSGNRRF